VGLATTGDVEIVEIRAALEIAIFFLLPEPWTAKRLHPVVKGGYLFLFIPDSS
jgi:hypothetical protein